MCPVRLQKPIDVDDPRHFKIKGIHRHAGDARKIGKKRTMTKLKTLAKTTKNSSRQIISESIKGVLKATAATLPSEKSMTKMIQRLRGGEMPNNPRSLSELNLPEEFRKTVKGENFLLHDSITDTGEAEKGRFLIFGTADNLKFLADCDHIYMDGTFTVVPALFKQLYTVHGKPFFLNLK